MVLAIETHSAEASNWPVLTLLLAKPGFEQGSARRDTSLPLMSLRSGIDNQQGDGKSHHYNDLQS